MKIYIDYKLLYYTDIVKIPHTDRIKKLNDFLDEKNDIYVWIEDNTVFLHEVVKNLEDWGSKIKNVRLGKPDYDMVIDENCMMPKMFFKE